MRQGRAILAAAVLVLLSVGPSFGVAMESAGREKAGEDGARIKALVEVVEGCVFRVDTEHHLFHGCVDWHSAVHGHWALLFGARGGAKALEPRLGGELGATVAARLTRAALDRELAFLKAGDAKGRGFEMPYGRAWFLQLARDGEVLYGLKTLRPTADYLYSTLMRYAEEDGGTIYSTRYDNASW